MQIIFLEVKKVPGKRERRQDPCKREIFSIGQVTEITSDSISFKDADENEKSVKLLLLQELKSVKTILIQRKNLKNFLFRILKKATG